MSKEEKITRKTIGVCTEEQYTLCPVARKQKELMDDISRLQKEVSELNANTVEIIDLFKESKAAFSFFSKAGKFLRWLALTIASISAIWAAFTHWKQP